MNLITLIKNQSIRIDDHQRGNRESKNWDDSTKDIHIDKTTNSRLNGIRQKIRIRVPINSDRDIIIEDGRGQRVENIPKRLEREIKDAFSNKKVREDFMRDVMNILRNYSTTLDDKRKIQSVLANLSRHFNLEWSDETIEIYAKDILEVYIQMYNYRNKLYYIRLDREGIQIAQNSGYSKLNILNV